jgi:hypothetical protein
VVAGGVDLLAPGQGWTPNWIWLGSATDTPPSGDITGSPVAVQLADGSVDVYARAADGSALEKYYTASTGWSRWVDLGGSITGDPAALANADGSVDVFVHTAGGGLWEKYWVPGQG